MPWLNRALHGRQDRLAVLRQDDQRVRTLRDQVLDVGQLLLRRRSGVRRDVLGAARLQRVLDRGLVPLRPALLVVVVPGDADGEALAPPVVPVVPVVSPLPLSSLLQAAPTIASTATSATIAKNRRFILSPPSGWTPQRRTILSPTTTACSRLRGFDTAVRQRPMDHTDAPSVLASPPGAPEPSWRHTMAQFPGPRNKTDRSCAHDVTIAREHRPGTTCCTGSTCSDTLPARARRSAHWSIRRSSQQTRSATSAGLIRPSGSPVSGGAEGSPPKRFGVTTSVRCSNGSTSRGPCPVPSSRP